MFGLTLTKLLFTILVIVLVWKGFAMVTRLARERQEALARHGGPQQRAGRRPAQRAGRGEASTVDLVRCPRCGAYHDPRERCGCGHGAP